jgi:molybdopterin converting factor subunit 1
MRVLYFAWLREKLGTAEEEVPPQPDVAALLAWQRTRGPAYAAAFAPGNRIRCAVNQEFAGPDSPIAAGDEVAFFPPVTGG